MVTQRLLASGEQTRSLAKGFTDSLHSVALRHNVSDDLPGCLIVAHAVGVMFASYRTLMTPGDFADCQAALLQGLQTPLQERSAAAADRAHVGT